MPINEAPLPMQDRLASLPDKYCGTLYATIKIPLLPIYTEHRVPVWGQVADGGEHRHAVENMLYSSFPLHGKGFTYVSWRNVPDRPDINDRARTGKIDDPKPYDGKAYWER